MKIQYKFADETVEIEVDQEWGQLIVEWNRIESSAARSKRRHSYSYDTKEYEGSEYGALDPEIENFGEDEEPDEVEVLYDGLSQLTDKQRSIIQMYYFENLTQDEIAKRLGVSKTAICKVLQRAVNQLKKFFHRPG